MYVKDLKTEAVKSAGYLIVGSDGYLIKQVEKFFRDLVGNDSLSVTTIDEVKDISAISNPLLAYNYMGNSNVVFVKDINLKKDKQFSSKLVELLKQSFEPNYLIFFYAEGNISSEVKKNLIPIDCNSPKKQDCIAYINKIFDNKIDYNAAILLRDATDCNLALVEIEKIKLFAYAGDRQITEEDVRNLIPENPQTKSFEFINAISNRKIDEAYIILDKLKRFGNDSAGILSMLINNFQKMLLIKLTDMTTDQIVKTMDVRDFVVTNTLRNKVFNKKIVKECLEILIDYQTRSRNSEIDGDLALDCAVAEIITKVA